MITVTIGSTTPDTQRLVNGAKEALDAAIAVTLPGARLGDIGAAVLAVARQHRLSVVREYCGHGIGREMHMSPQVPHVGTRGHGLRLRPGMAFTIEPMLNLGTEACVLCDDGWTVKTTDGKWSAQFEHTVLVTANGCEVLTGNR